MLSFNIATVYWSTLLFGSSLHSSSSPIAIFHIFLIGARTMHGAMGATAPIKFALWGHLIFLHTAFASNTFCPAPIRKNIFLRPSSCRRGSHIHITWKFPQPYLYLYTGDSTHVWVQATEIVSGTVEMILSDECFTLYLFTFSWKFFVENYPLYGICYFTTL